ncbi:hypothetical protein C8R45DRAFT_933821 [Mycena sanguinolenta]|nr:hypothetical protein C8R45DRAFT_933821 [Mycena sanguinolenta]
MRLKSFAVFLHLAGTLRLVIGAVVFNWPDPFLDTLDRLLYEQSDVATFAETGVARDNSTFAAQWLRLAYHDMATHNNTSGTGGLDASIQFEFTRPQNFDKKLVSLYKPKQARKLAKTRQGHKLASQVQKMTRSTVQLREVTHF